MRGVASVTLGVGGIYAPPVLAIALGLCFQGATYDIASHLVGRLPGVRQDSASSSPKAFSLTFYSFGTIIFWHLLAPIEYHLTLFKFVFHFTYFK